MDIDLRKIAVGEGFDTTETIRALAKAVVDLQGGDSEGEQSKAPKQFQADTSLNSLLGMSVATLLFKSGFKSADEIKNATDDELLAIDGVGAATLRSIRESLG